MELDRLYNQIFTERSATSRDTFIVSTAYELRHAVNGRDELYDNSVGPSALPNWLEPALPLGPYERRLFNNLITGSDNLLVLRSGTGSGKSSIVQYISSFCHNKTNRTRFRSGSRPYDSFFHVVDLEASNRIFFDDVESTSDRYQATIDQFLHHITEYLSELVYKLIPNESSKIYKENILSFLDGYDRRTSNRISTVLGRILRDSRRYASINNSADILNYIISDKIPQLKLYDDQIHIYLAILSAISSQCRSSEPSMPLVIVFDNIDQISAYLQSVFCLQLQSFFSDDYFAASGLRTVIMMRLSSAADKVASLPNPPTLNSHESPNVIDLLTIRCMNFLLKPELFSHFFDLDEHTKLIAYEKIYQFYMHLIDTKGDMRVLLQGLSGTNIRLATRHALKWLNSYQSRLNPESTVPKAIIEVRQSNILAAAVPNTVIKIINSICRGLDSISRDYLNIHGSDNTTPSELASDLFFDLIEIIVFVFKNSRLVEHRKHSVKGIRCAIAATIANELATTLKSRANERQSPSRDVLVDRIALFISRHALFSREVHPDQIKSALASIIEQYDLIEKNVVQDLIDDEYLDHPFIRHVCRIVQDALDVAVNNFDIKKNRIEFQTPLRSLSMKYFEDADRFIDSAPNFSRYDSAQLMLQRVQNSDGHDLFPINMYDVGFMKDRRVRIPIRIYILYYLRRNNMNGKERTVSTYNSLRELALSLDFSEIDVDRVIMEFIRRDRRLIYSGVHDDALDISKWKAEADRHIRMTWSGIRYARDLVPLPAYVQWCFEQQEHFLASVSLEGEIHDKGRIEGRFWSALRAFEAIVSEEKRMLDLRSEADAKSFTISGADRVRKYEMSVLGAPVFDAFVRSSADFVSAIANSARGIIARTTRERNLSRLDSDTIATLRTIMSTWISRLEFEKQEYGKRGLHDEAYDIIIGWLRHDFDSARIFK